jgi:hypothetical protein
MKDEGGRIKWQCGGKALVTVHEYFLIQSALTNPGQLTRAAVEVKGIEAKIFAVALTEAAEVQGA